MSSINTKQEPTTAGRRSIRKTNGIICAVCGKYTKEHGDGFKIPETTCLLCYDHRIKQNKIDKELEKQKDKKRCG